MVQPIQPEDIAEEFIKSIPPEVIESFNELIVLHFNGDSSVVLQAEVVERMLEKGLSRKDIYSRGWLNVESIYRKAGWSVDYDRPGYNEVYPAKFIFRHRG